MTNEKLKELVAEQNSQLEQEAALQARRLIRQIVDARQCIVRAQEEIVSAQAELRALQVTQLDPISILGA